MKQLLIFCFFSLTIFSFNPNTILAQKSAHQQEEKKDTTGTTILGGKTHSADENGCKPSNEEDTRDFFIIIIEDLTIKNVEKMGAVPSRAKVRAKTISPNVEQQTYSFRKTKNEASPSDWKIQVHCAVEKAVLNIDFSYRQYGIVKPLNVNATEGKSLKLFVDFVTRQVFVPSLEGKKKLIGSFDETLTFSGKKLPNSTKGVAKIRVE